MNNILKSIGRFSVSPWFLAIIPTIIIVFFLPAIGTEYSLIIERNSDYNGQFVFEDLNGDSISELLLARSEIPYNAVVVNNNESQIYDQWNIPDSLAAFISELYFGDYDHNGFKEIYIFSVKGDSIFLNVNEFFKPNGLHINRKFISKIELAHGSLVSSIYFAGLFDSSGDGKDELYFGMVSGFGKEPRRLYSFDLAHQKLNQTPFTGNIPYDYFIDDLDNDGRPEISGNITAPGNYKTKVPYSDSSTWLMVFNDKLQFKFPPPEFKGFTNGLFVKPFCKGKDKYLILLHTYGGTDTSVLSERIMVFSPNGELVRFKTLEKVGCGNHPALCILQNEGQDEIVLIGTSICILNEKLDIVNTIEKPAPSYLYSFKADVNGDDIDDLFLYSDVEHKIAVYNSNFKLKLTSNIELNIPDIRVSYRRTKQRQKTLFIKSGKNTNFIYFNKNRFYLFSYFAYPGIYLAILLFILLIRRITVYQISQRENLKRRLINLQLQSIKSQLDPHFTFNALNSIAALIYEDDRQSAYDHMNKFTQLLRRMLNDADRIYRSLKEELEFVKTYLDLETLRFGDKFTYQIEIGPGISENEQVPKMVLQTFAENAIKHGILPRPTGGKLIIKAEKEIDTIKLTIEDNGIGRVNSSGQSTSTGKGLKITDEFYDILNQINKRPIKHVITDLYDPSGLAVGTRVEVWVPVD